MNELIYEDAAAARELFLWNGPLDRASVDCWIEAHGWQIPADLRDFWTVTGGGEMFESERLLRPLFSTNHTDEIVDVTTWYEQRGLPGGLVVFHDGLGVTAIRQLDAAYLHFDCDLRSAAQYSSLADWYVRVLRAEYGDRYGLRTRQ